MFTLRFIRDNGQTVVSAARYDRTDIRQEMCLPHACLIMIYPQTASDSGGVEFRIDEDGGPLAFRVCYVENALGKTIDRIGPYTVAKRD